MEFPMHKDMTHFYFYDVLALISRHACESQFYIKYSGNLDDVREKIVTVAKAKGYKVSNEEIEREANQKCQELARDTYDAMLFRTVNMPANIEMVGDLKTLSNKVAK
jgi:cysteinyl-tRNA synthetase